MADYITDLALSLLLNPYFFPLILLILVFGFLFYIKARLLNARKKLTWAQLPIIIIIGVTFWLFISSLATPLLFFIIFFGNETVNGLLLSFSNINYLYLNVLYLFIFGFIIAWLILSSSKEIFRTASNIEKAKKLSTPLPFLIIYAAFFNILFHFQSLANFQAIYVGLFDKAFITIIAFLGPIFYLIFAQLLYSQGNFFHFDLFKKICLNMVQRLSKVGVFSILTCVVIIIAAIIAINLYPTPINETITLQSYETQFWGAGFSYPINYISQLTPSQYTFNYEKNWNFTNNYWPKAIIYSDPNINAKDIHFVSKFGKLNYSDTCADFKANLEQKIFDITHNDWYISEEKDFAIKTIAPLILTYDDKINGAGACLITAPQFSDINFFADYSIVHQNGKFFDPKELLLNLNSKVVDVNKRMEINYDTNYSINGLVKVSLNFPTDCNFSKCTKFTNDKYDTACSLSRAQWTNPDNGSWVEIMFRTSGQPNDKTGKIMVDINCN